VAPGVVRTLPGACSPASAWPPKPEGVSGTSLPAWPTGHATVTTDKAKIKELWTPLARTWFTGGIDDPRITAAKVVPTDGYYWDNKHGDTVAGIKMLVGAALRKALDDSVEGKIGV
jgi:hypothetical protein